MQANTLLSRHGTMKCKKNSREIALDFFESQIDMAIFPQFMSYFHTMRF